MGKGPQRRRKETEVTSQVSLEPCQQEQWAGSSGREQKTKEKRELSKNKESKWSSSQCTACMRLMLCHTENTPPAEGGRRMVPRDTPDLTRKRSKGKYGGRESTSALPEAQESDDKGEITEGGCELSYEGKCWPGKHGMDQPEWVVMGTLQLNHSNSPNTMSQRTIFKQKTFSTRLSSTVIRMKSD